MSPRTRTGSGPGVGLPVGRTQTFHRDVRVDLGAARAGVPQELLHATQIRAPVEQVGGGAVAQVVRPTLQCGGAQTRVHVLTGLSYPQTCTPTPTESSTLRAP